MRKPAQAIRPDLNLLVYDAARPSVQREPQDMVKGTAMKRFRSQPEQRPRYALTSSSGRPDANGLHRQPLPMGSCYDFFGDEARITDERQLLDSARITGGNWKNRLLLRRVMTEAGFTTISEEWWHFNIMPTAEARKNINAYRLNTPDRAEATDSARSVSRHGILFTEIQIFRRFGNIWIHIHACQRNRIADDFERHVTEPDFSLSVQQYAVGQLPHRQGHRVRSDIASNP